MYLIRNNDGSIRKALTEEYIQQCSNNVNYMDFAIVDRSVSDWTADCLFELPNGEVVQLAGTQQEFEVDNETFTGYRVYLSSAVLSYAGILKITARIYNASGDILYTYPFKQMVNATSLDSTYDAPITIAQYNSFMALLATYITKYDTHLIRKYDTLANANADIANLSVSEHVLVSSGVDNYAIYAKLNANDTELTLVPSPTNWSDIESYTGLTTSDLSKLGLATLKEYIDKYDVKGVDNNLLTGVLTTTLTLKDLSTLVATVNFSNLYYSKDEVYSKEESDERYLSQAILEAYLTIAQAKEEYLLKVDASVTYLSKVDAGTTYQTKSDAETKHAAQDTAILAAQNKADSAYALASGKASVHIFDTYADMKKALKEDDGTGFALGDSINIRAKNTADYWISKKLNDNTGEFGYYEILEDETDLSNYQTIEDSSLETTHKTIVGAINENKANIETKQSKTDNSLTTTNKTIVGGINELKSNVSDLQTKDTSIDAEIANLKSKDTSLENSISSLNTALNDKQSKTDVSLNTDSKTITGAINELKEDIQANADNINLIEDKIPTKVSQLTNDKNYIDKSVNNLENYKTTAEITTILGNYALKTDIPTDNATLTNGANYIKKDVNNLDNYYLNTETDTKLGTKVNKSGDTMTGTLIAPIIQTGSDANNYFQCQKFRGQGDVNTYYHAVDFGYQSHDRVDFYEYGGIFNFWKNQSIAATTNTSNRVASLQLGKLLERGNTLTYPGKSGTFALTSDLPTKVSEMTDATDYVKFTDFMSDTKAGVAYAIPTTDVANLANVYIKEGILYAKANPVPVLNIIKVDTLPTVGESSTIYLVPLSTQEAQNKYKEYMYVDSAWEELGTTEIDLSEYATIEWVQTQIKVVSDNFANYYTSTAVDTKLSSKLDSSKFTATNIVSTIGTNAVNRAVADQNGNIIETTYATKADLEDYVDLENNQTISGVKTFNAPTNISGQEQATAIFKTSNGGKIILGKEKSNEGTVIALDQVSGTRRLNFRASSVSGAMIWEQPESNSIIYFDVINVDFRKTTSITFDNIKNAPFLGTNSSGKVISVSASDLVSKLGTTAVNRATSDASGNNIENTYAKKTELTSKLDNTSTAIVNTLGDTAVNKATKAIQDENGNNIASTYQRSAFIVNGSVATGGTITFTDLVISDLLSAINNNQRIVFIPSDTSLASVDLNAIKTSDTSYTLKGSFTANVSSKLTNYSCVIIATSSSASGTYTSQTANDVDSATLVNLTGAQSISGIKTFTNEIKTNQVANNNDNAMIRYKSTENKVVLGGSTIPTTIMGSADRPNYSKDGSDFTGSPLALLSDIPSAQDTIQLLSSFPTI